MKHFLALGLCASLLGACSAPQPAPQDDYFSTVNSSDQTVQDAQRRLAEAEGRIAAAEARQAALDAQVAQIPDLPEANSQASATAPVDPSLPQPTRSEISNSQDFDEFTAIETIEGDAETQRILAETYRTYAPTALPQRPNSVDLAKYAVDNLNHPVGNTRYSRRNTEQTRNVCGDYRDQDLAQFTFLARGGPRQDVLNIDPDGDGFACRWTPSSYLGR